MRKAEVKFCDPSFLLIVSNITAAIGNEIVLTYVNLTSGPRMAVQKQVCKSVKNGSCYRDRVRHLLMYHTLSSASISLTAPGLSFGIFKPA
jgi:hypothetical protein